MYHVIGTVLTTSLFYLFSYFLCRAGFLSRQTHRIIWNVLLAFSFIATALAGIFMALQVSYKWDIPFVKQILKWHVEFGIGMTITGLFHLIWHMPYFTGIFTKSEFKQVIISNPVISSVEIRINMFIVGFVSTAIQILFIREMMNIAGGYELISGTLLASWLICSAAGATAAAKSNLNDIRRINLFFSVSTIVSLVLMILLSRLYLNPGQTPSLLESIVFTLLVLSPFCFISGFTFIKLIGLASAEKSFSPGKSFSIETTGGIISGIIISVLTAGILNTYQIILLMILISNGYVIYTYFIESNKAKTSVKLIIFVLATGIILLRPDVFFRQLLLPGLNINYCEDTPYGNITIGEYKGESSIFYNQRLLTYNYDVAETEENIHYAMAQSQSPETVILISGSLNSHINEILKYPVKKITYLERDPALTRKENILQDSLPENLVIVNTDAFRYLRSMEDSADVIILLVPPPSTLLMNRYYTTEFFTEIKKRLKTGGIFMCSPGQGDNYLNKESVALYSSIFNSMSVIFKNVIPLLGNKLYFLGSDSELSTSICKLIDLRKIQNVYVGPDYLADDLIDRKSQEILILMDSTIIENRITFPVASYHYQSYNFSKNINEKAPSIAILVLLFAMPVLAVKRRNMVMYFSASALAGFEIIALLTLQITVGNMYQLTGLIIGGLMAGLAAGAATDNRILSSISIRMKCIILMLFYIITALSYNLLITIINVLPEVILLIFLTFVPGFITGNIFRVLTMKTEGLKNTPGTYSSDLAGSAFGFILISGFAVPVFGTTVSIFLLSVMIFAGFLFGTVTNK